MTILGVNGAGYESANLSFVEGVALPWLQDTTAQGAWASWRVEYRDVVVVDGEGLERSVYNLTSHDLAQPANAAELERLMLEARSRREEDR